MRVAMSDERDPEARSEIDKAIAVGVDDVRTPRLDPDDRVVARAGLFFAAFTPSRQCGAFTRRQALYPRLAGGRRDGALDSRECVAIGHCAVLAQGLTGERFRLPRVEDDRAFPCLAEHVVAVDQQYVDLYVVGSARVAQVLDDCRHVVSVVVGDS